MNRVELRHGHVTLALHELRSEHASPTAKPLLLLHGLGDRSPHEVPAWIEPWSGPVWALDFTGHGASSSSVGGGYTCEVLMADVDAALAHIGPATVLGRGLGAYITLLIAGARPHLVRGAVLCDGPGTPGGGTGPASGIVLPTMHVTGTTPDPWALVELGRDLRPTDYATGFARQATQLSGLEWPIAVCARWRCPWLDAVSGEAGVLDTSIGDALTHYSTVT